MNDDLQRKARIYEMTSGLPPLSVLDFLVELAEDGWTIQPPIAETPDRIAGPNDVVFGREGIFNDDGTLNIVKRAPFNREIILFNRWRIPYAPPYGWKKR